MICAQAVVQFRPNESYEKYLKLLVSVMILAQLFLPLASLIAREGRMETDTLLSSFWESMEQGMEEARRQAEETDALLKEMTLEEVRRRLEEQQDISEGETVEKAAKEMDEKAAENVAGEADKEAENTVEETGKGAGNEENGDLPEGRITVEVEPVAPILGEQTGGARADGE